MLLNKEVPKPPESTWTDDQWKAITASGKDILVAAAAGSGKTAVLVERIIRKIVSAEESVDVDRLLIVTFTNASAAEMRNRIGEALEKALKEHPESIHLRRQLSLLNRASISTLHSFCLNVIRKYYYLIEIDPGFRIANDTEAELLRDEVMEGLLEEEYSQPDNDRFFDLVDRYSNDRSDIELQNMIRKLYEFSLAHPSPNKWLDQIEELYDVGNKQFDDMPFLPYLLTDINLQLDGAKTSLLKALDITREPAGPAPRAVTIEEDLEQLNRLLAAKEQSWASLYEEMQTVVFKTAKPCKGNDYDATLLKMVTKLRDDAKAQVKALKEDLFSRKPQSYLKDLEDMKPAIETLVYLVKEFAVKFQAVKQEKGLVDFADLEHYCLEILRHPDSKEGRLIPSQAALEYRTQFEEVLVDEYQDTNMVQESILQLVTKDSDKVGNLFMVGDVKQSIYRFRLAEPFLFLSKYKKFDKQAIDTGLRIDLSKNFRSRSEVLDGTNFLFKQIMGETIGEIDYDDDAELKLGANYPESEQMSAELLLIDRKGQGDEEEPDQELEEDEAVVTFNQAELETAQLEARTMANKIKELVSNQFQVFDRNLGRTRNITYRDIVVLMRSMPWAPQIIDEFKQQGIPVYADLSTGYFEATEVAIMMSLLKVIDNPFQDIPLASVLRSPIVGLDTNELASVRIHEKKSNFYEAIKEFIRLTSSANPTYQKVKNFYDKLNQWRIKARSGGLSDLIWELYRETGFFDFVGGMPGGKQRQANLRALYDRARQYESTSFRGLFRFLRFVERMQDRGDDLGAARALGEQEDVVRIMTIHRSKGLEFPVVFVAGLSKQFNMMDLNKKYLLDKELGLGSKYINPKLRISYPTLPMLSIKKKMKLEMIAEEMRVLYVALTRAKEKLIMVGTVKDKDKQLEKWQQELTNEEWLLSKMERAKAKSYLDWIGPGLVRHESCGKLRVNEAAIDHLPKDISHHPAKWRIEFVNTMDLLEMINEEQKQNEQYIAALKEGTDVDSVSEYKEQINRQLRWSYPFGSAANYRSKQSVSEIKRQKDSIDENSDTAFIKKFRAPLVDRPRFMQQKSLTPAERGTAMHMVMQHVNLNEQINEVHVKEQIAKMIHNELLTLEQADVIDIGSIVNFFETDLGQRLVKATESKREVPFSVGIPASEAYPDWQDSKEENVLIQGVIDCIFEDEDGIVLIDYKTDTITARYRSFEDAKPILEERYRIQLELYSKAIEYIWRKPLKERYLYFFDGGYLLKV